MHTHSYHVSCFILFFILYFTFFYYFHFKRNSSSNVCIWRLRLIQGWNIVSKIFFLLTKHSKFPFYHNLNPNPTIILPNYRFLRQSIFLLWFWTSSESFQIKTKWNTRNTSNTWYSWGYVHKHGGCQSWGFCHDHTLRFCAWQFRQTSSLRNGVDTTENWS